MCVDSMSYSFYYGYSFFSALYIYISGVKCVAKDTSRVGLQIYSDASIISASFSLPYEFRDHPRLPG